MALLQEDARRPEPAGYVMSQSVIRIESGQDVEDVFVIMAATGQRPFRGELDPPAGCGS